MRRDCSISRVYRPLLVPLWLALAAAAQAADIRVVGGSAGGESWEERAAAAPIIDFTSLPGWILPSFIDTTTNIALGTLARGGRVVSPNAQAVLRGDKETLAANLASMVDGDHQTAFEVKNITASGILVIFDLGARFGVNRIRFFPRTSFPDDFMRGYALFINDGIFGAEFVAESVDGLPSKNLFAQIDQQTGNSQDTVNVQFPLRYVRYLLLQATDRSNWEIDEIEVFGRGFVPEADYLSQVFDFNQPTLWGQLHWAAEAVGHPEKSRFFIRTRSGTSPSPTDVPDAWSPWSAPYLSGDTPILSPAPRQYFQFRLDFESDGLEDGTAVDSLAFEFSDPVAESIVGEIWPQNVPVGVDTVFTYAVQVVGSRGFDRLEIDSSVPVHTVRSLHLDDLEVEDFVAESHESGLRVTFPHQSGNHDLRMVFDAAILRYETVFSGRLRDSQSDGLPQEIEEGDAAGSMLGDDLSVRVPLNQDPVVHRVTVTPNPFTPNGDGINDQTTISYDLLHLINDVPVSLQVYDLAGRQVAELPVGKNQSGRHLVHWNGQNDQGRYLPPGLYVLQVKVATDSGTVSRNSTVAVVY